MSANECPSMPEVTEDRRPRYQRFAHQSFLQGYSLIIDEPRARAVLRNGHSYLSIGLTTSKDVARNMPEFHTQIIYLRENRIMAETEERKAITLDKGGYTANELAEITGMSSAGIHYHRSKLTAKQSGTDHNSPWIYWVDEKLVSLLEERGFDVTLAGDALSAELIQDEAAKDVQASGDGQDGLTFIDPKGDEPIDSPETEAAPQSSNGTAEDESTSEAVEEAASEVDDEMFSIDWPINSKGWWENWTPTPENIDELPEPLREAWKEMEHGLTESHREFDQLERNVLDICESEEITDPMAAIGCIEAEISAWKRRANEQLERAEKYDALEEAVQTLCEGRVYRGEGEGPLKMIERMASAHDEITRQYNIHKKSAAEAIAELEKKDTAIRSYRRRTADLEKMLSARIEAAEKAVEHAHKKDKADGHYEAEQEREYSITEIIERAGIHSVTIDGEQLTATFQTNPLERLRKAFVNLAYASVDGDEQLSAETRETFREVCSETRVLAKRMWWAAVRVRVKALFTRLVRA